LHTGICSVNRKVTDHFEDLGVDGRVIIKIYLNPLSAKLNPICHLLALLRAHHIFHVSRTRVNKIRVKTVD
jgi:hypothetical protein